MIVETTSATMPASDMAAAPEPEPDEEAAETDEAAPPTAPAGE
jgi:hypothetical protein